METLDSLHSVEAHVAGRAHASTCTAGRLVAAYGDSSRSRASPHRRRWTPRCSEPGYGGAGVTVHPACDPSQPSVTQSDALPGQPKIPYRKVVYGICASVSAPLLLLECSHTACGESLCPGEPVSAPVSHACNDTYINSPGGCLGAASARTRDGAYRDRARRREQVVDTACHHEGRMPVNVSIALVRRINRRQRQ